MGGSSLAPEVICATAGVELTVLDSSYPDMVRAALSDRLERTVVVVSSKSGSTVETDSQRRAFEAAFTEAGIDPTARIVVVTDPGSPLDEEARAAGYRVVNADPNVGGRYSALTAFGLVPSGPGRRRHRGAARRGRGRRRPARRGRRGQPRPAPGRRHGRHRRRCATSWSWSTAARASSASPTGPSSSSPRAPASRAPASCPSSSATPTTPRCAGPRADVTVARLVGDSEDDGALGRDARQRPAPLRGRTSAGALGAQMMLWEVATAAAGRLLGINPFDQPDVESAKKAARGLLDAAGSAAGAGRPSPTAPSRSAPSAATGSARPATVATALDALFDQLDPHHGYVAVMAYLDRLADAQLADVPGAALARRTERPTTFGWGPRFLHSTGQFHKGGPATGVYLQVTAAPHQDLAVPGRDVHLRRLHRRAGRRRRAGAGRPRPAGAAAAPDRPRRRTGPAGRRPAPAHVLRIGRRRMSPARVAHGTNPLRDPRDKRLPRIAGPCGLVLFGVTGDLARKKLMPAIYDLANRGLLPPGFSLVGFARRDWADQDFGKIVYDAVKAARPHAVPRGGLAQPGRGIPFRARHVRRPRGVRPARRDGHAAWRQERGTGGNHAFYLSIPPGFFSTVCEQLDRSGPVQARAPARGAGSSSRSRSATTSRAPASSTTSSSGSSRPTRSSASTTTSARRRSRTSWPCASPTRCSSRSGTPTTSTTCRSPWPRTSASAVAPATTTASAPRAT